jgi:hypothetical protein
MERQMTEAVTITNEELAILCDIVAGWRVAKYQHTAKTDLLFTQLCVGISGG